ncbi:hypothetical protein FA15DRAFT_719103 [Coprinopsis marcescibilis]|uniref:Uncharacterized protein n=1 Tax=Coprinopsis marcescibilis TaxID=230819 RepID=A0A5C3KLK1_COPMA|nr:hypothetical protein FA15DRAFT_719103 [Coprinopsis marcescibilis]
MTCVYKLDELCQKFCNPAPNDGSQPNLVIVALDAQGQPYFKHAFNTQVCKQLNAWLVGFSAILKRMTACNFKWLIHVMLYYHTKIILSKQGNGVGNMEASREDEVDEAEESSTDDED